MVFTVGNDNDGLADTLLLGEAMGGHLDGSRHVRSLCGHHRGVDVGQEHLGRHVVAGDRQLNKGVASKDDETNLVVGEVVDQILDHHLRTVQTAWRHILSTHRVTDVDTDDRLNARTLLVADLRAHLWTGKRQDEQRQGSRQQPELYTRAPARHIGHQLFQQKRVAELAQTFLLFTIGHKPDGCQQRNQQQQVQVLWVFKSKHYGILLNTVIRSNSSSSRASTATRAKGW